MTITRPQKLTARSVIEARMNPYFRRIRRRFEEMDCDQRAMLDRGFERHIDACRKSGIAPDPQWVAEAVEDIAAGRY